MAKIPTVRKNTMTEYRITYGAFGPSDAGAVKLNYLRSALAVVQELKHHGEPNVRLWTREVTEWAEIT